MGRLRRKGWPFAIHSLPLRRWFADGVCRRRSRSVFLTWRASGPGHRINYITSTIGGQCLCDSSIVYNTVRNGITTHQPAAESVLGGSQLGPEPPFPYNTSRFHLWRSSPSVGLKTEAVFSPAFFTTSLPAWTIEASFFLALFRCSMPHRAASAFPYLTLCVSTPRSFRTL